MDHALRMCAYCSTVTLQIVVDLCSMTMMGCEMSCCSPACKCIREESKVGIDMPCYVWSIWFRNTSFHLTFLFEDGLVGLGCCFVLFFKQNSRKHWKICQMLLNLVSMSTLHLNLNYPSQVEGMKFSGRPS